MFKIGDKVVCIDNMVYDEEIKELSLYKLYTIHSISNISGLYKFKNLDNFLFSDTRFILLSEFRKQKINKIKRNICH